MTKILLLILLSLPLFANANQVKTEDEEDGYLDSESMYNLLDSQMDDWEQSPYYTGLDTRESRALQMSSLPPEERKKMAEKYSKQQNITMQNSEAQCPQEDDACQDKQDLRHGLTLNNNSEEMAEMAEMDDEYYKSLSQTLPQKPVADKILAQVDSQANTQSDAQIENTTSEQNVSKTPTPQLSGDDMLEAFLLLQTEQTEQTEPQNTSQNNNSPVKIGLDGNFEFASSNMPSGAVAQGSSQRFGSNFQTRSSAFLRADFERNINENVKLAIKTEFDIGSNAQYDEDEAANLNKLFLQLKIKNGSTTELGTSKMVSENLRVDASTFAKGSGGIDGDLFRLISQQYSSGGSSGGGANTAFIMVPRSPFASGFANSAFLGNNSGFNVGGGNAKLGNGDDFASFSYYTRRFYGLKFAASFAPETEDAQSKKSSRMLSGYASSSQFVVKNAYSVLANYYKPFAGQKGSFVFTVSHDGGRVGLDATNKNIITPANTTVSRNDINVSTAGFNVEYLGFIAGSSYSHWGKSMYYSNGSQIAGLANSMGDDSSRGESYYHTHGIGYSFGPAAVSLGTMQSKFMGNKFANYVLSTDYNLISEDGYKIKHFVEISRFNFTPHISNQSPTLRPLTGYALMSGFKVVL